MSTEETESYGRYVVFRKITEGARGELRSEDILVEFDSVQLVEPGQVGGQSVIYLANGEVRRVSGSQMDVVRELTDARTAWEDDVD